MAVVPVFPREVHGATVCGSPYVFLTSASLIPSLTAPIERPGTIVGGSCTAVPWLCLAGEGVPPPPASAKTAARAAARRRTEAARTRRRFEGRSLGRGRGRRRGARPARAASAASVSSAPLW